MAKLNLRSIEGGYAGSPDLPGGGEPPYDDTMEKIARLEVQMEHVAAELGDVKERLSGVESTVGAVRERLSGLEGKISDMPTKDWMTTRLFWVVGAFLALTALVQIVISAVAGTLGA